MLRKIKIKLSFFTKFIKSDSFALIINYSLSPINILIKFFLQNVGSCPYLMVSCGSEIVFEQKHMEKSSIKIFKKEKKCHKPIFNFKDFLNKKSPDRIYT